MIEEVGGLKMVEHIIEGNEQHKEGITKAIQLANGDILRFQFDGGCDARSGPVLSVVGELDKLKADYEIKSRHGPLRHDPANDEPHMPHDCYHLIEKQGSGSVHPQDVNEIVVYGRNNS